MATAAALLTFIPLQNPNPKFGKIGAKCSANVISSSRSLVAGRRLDLGRRISAIVPFAAAKEGSEHLEIEVENEKSELGNIPGEPHEAWKQTFESFKEEAEKMKQVSQEAYELYSKKAAVILKQTSEMLKIQAEKARHEMGLAAQEFSKDGKLYLYTAAKNSPDSVKDIIITFASADKLHEMSAVRDFYLGIPYGAILVVGGFLSFMLTGSISAIRFGVILGSALLALSISSLRSWKNGQSSEILLKGQAAIAAVIFIRELRLFCQKRLFSTSMLTLISGAAVAFYVYRIMIDDNSKDPNPETAENNPESLENERP